MLIPRCRDLLFSSGAILPKIKTFIYIALAIFRGCGGSSEPSLLAYVIGTIIS